MPIDVSEPITLGEWFPVGNEKVAFVYVHRPKGKDIVGAWLGSRYLTISEIMENESLHHLYHKELRKCSK